MKITTKEIAKICGVSRGTVDRALNNKPGINEKTKAEIIKTAEMYGYSPNFIGRSLVTGKTRSLGVVVFNFKNQYFSQMLNAIEIRMREKGFALLIMMSEKSMDNETSAIKSLCDRMTDGIILHPVGFGEEYEAFLKSIKLPIVSVGNRLSSDFDYISIDNEKAAYDGTYHIYQKGYEDIVFISPPLRKKGIENISAQEERRDGYLKAVSELGISEHVISSKKYIDEAAAHFVPGEGKTAFFCSSDLYALELIKTMREKSMDMEKVGIMGFDRIGMLDYISPKLSTIYNPIEQMGISAVERLIERVNNNNIKAQNIVLEHHIVHGETL